LTLNFTTIDNNTYSAQLKPITVCANILDGYKPKRTTTESEFIEHNKPLFIYVAKYTWLTEAQVFSFLRQEQGNSSDLFILHNNPFNIKGSGVMCRTWEETINNVEYHQFKSYKTLQEGLRDFIKLMNTKYYTEPLSNEEHSKWLYDKGYFTDRRYYIRTILANRYKNKDV
jgi:hypothetical protein